MSTYVIIREMQKMLRNLDSCLEKATAQAATKKYDTSVLLQSRLAPDMFPLMRQIQATCDQAKYAASRTAGKETPSNADTEQTMEEARKRIATVVAYLDTFSPTDFDGIEKRTVTTPRWEGKSMTAVDYLAEHSVPNFFFHLTTSYAILRHNGIEVGKRDFLGALTMR